MPVSAYVEACLFAVGSGYALALWAMRVNRFFSSVIRIQTDRGQHVVTTGPYAFVRHPGYTAGILIMARGSDGASSPAFGESQTSLWGSMLLNKIGLLPSQMGSKRLKVPQSGHS